ncbi:MAG: right-handed parallel beta-helix repeat-containing protein [Parvularculaceae bacterium]|nr:right-handed parallel beta-helix repeat-containing protein [Parvularculaceae bacterium]
MARTQVTLKKALLAGLASMIVLPAVASAQIGGFDTEITKESKKAKPKKQDIVDVRLDPAWNGPRSIDEALKLVKENGEIIVHPGVYKPEFIKLRKSVTIRGIRDSYGDAPTLMADGGCVSISSDHVSARLTDLTFRASDSTCISVAKGQLELEASEIQGKNARYAVPATNSAHLAAFNENAAINSRSALVSVRGGRVSIANTKLVGGETGVKIETDQTGNSFEHVDLRNNTIAQMTGAGVVLVGNVDATLSSNSIISNGMGGVVYSASGHTRLVGNVISNNAYNGLYIEGNREAISVEANQIHDNSDDGIEVRSGTAILVGNEIGDHNGCRVKESPLDPSVSAHLGKPPINLLADARGVNAYATKNGCDKGKKADENKKRRGWFRRSR